MAHPNEGHSGRTGVLHSRWSAAVIVSVVVAATAYSWVAAQPDDARPRATDGDASEEVTAPGAPPGTPGDLSGPPFSTLDSWIAELGSIGGAQDLTEHIGKRVQLVIDSGQAMNDVAFWTGRPPDDVLVVINRDTRSMIERQTGRASNERGLGSPPRGTITVAGVIEPVPYPEATYSWGLTRRDVDLLAERGVYIKLTHVVSSAPHRPGEGLRAEEVDEHGRETAPPPGDQVETTVPPPLP